MDTRGSATPSSECMTLSTNSRTAVIRSHRARRVEPQKGWLADEESVITSTRLRRRGFIRRGSGGRNRRDDSVRRAKPRSRMPGPLTFDAPIPGIETDLATARASAAFDGVPILPRVSLTDVCTGEPTPLQLLGVWTRTADPGSSGQLGFLYSNGVWMSAEDVKEYDAEVMEGVELRPIDDVIDASSTSLFTSNVDGHVAWSKDLSPYFSCPDATDDPNVTSATPGAPSPHERRIFDPTLTASLRWVENDVMIHLVGPLPLSDLRQLAEGITWK